MQVKSLLFIAMMTPMMSLANNLISHQEVVGDWRCVIKEDNFSHTDLMRYHADNTATEMIEGRYKYSDHDAIETILLKYRWRIEGDRLYMSDNQLLDYKYYYQFDGMPIQTDELTTEAMREGLLQSINEHDWHYMVFDGRDKHRAFFEDGFSTNCERLK